MPAASANAVDPGFDFINKSGHTVTILVINDGKRVKQEVVFATGMLSKLVTSRNLSAEIDINKETEVIVLSGEIKQNIIAMKTEGTDWLIYAPGRNEADLYTFTPGKQIYVTLHEDSKLDPQTGPKGGTTGKTDAGYSLENVVTKSDIKYQKRTAK